MDPNEKWPELSAMLGELGSKLDRLIDAGMEKALPDYADGIVLSATTQTVQLHEGYRYNYLVVSTEAATAMGSSNTLTIDTPGIKYTQPIYEGINPLNIKGSTAKLSVSGLSGEYAAQFVETNESPLVRSAGSVKLAGTGTVQLTGSLAVKPTQIINLIGSYDVATQTFTAGSETVAASSSYTGAIVNMAGYENVSFIAVANSASTSTHWVASVTPTIEGLVNFNGSNGNIVTTAGAGYSVLQGNAPDWPTLVPTVANSDTSNALELQYFGVWLY